jgi:hypothetical protein
LNEIGYGQPDSGLIVESRLQSGRSAPAAAAGKARTGLPKILAKSSALFNHLYCLTNMPITRYATHLKLRGEYDRYLELLETTSTTPRSIRSCAAI